MKVAKEINYYDFIKWASAFDLNSSSFVNKEKIFISSISTDTRTIERDDFFIPVVGENFDGHDYIIEAVGKGCSGFVVQEDHAKYFEGFKNIIDAEILKKLIVLQTKNTIEFLLNIAKNYIRQFNLKVAGITGSVGKTTTKNFLVNIMSDDFKVKFTPRNYNTEIGISASIFQIDSTTEFFIAELGMRAKGQITQLCKVLDPVIGAITSVSPSHLEFFKNMEEVAMAKAEIGFWLKENGGVLFLNNDDRWTDFVIEKTGCNFKRFGRNSDLQYCFYERDCDDMGRYSFDLYLNKQKITDIKLKIPGYHNIYNACCAAAISGYSGVSADSIKYGIESTSGEENRMNIFSKSEKIIINDCYNANPLSMQMAIDTLKMVASKHGSRSVAILADMLELGENSDLMHFNLGKYIFQNKIDVLITFGSLSFNILEGFRSAESRDKNKKSDLKNVYHFEDRKKLIESLPGILKCGDTVLLKGSRANRLETLIDYI